MVSEFLIGDGSDGTDKPAQHLQSIERYQSRTWSSRVQHLHPHCNVLTPVHSFHDNHAPDVGGDENGQRGAVSEIAADR